MISSTEAKALITNEIIEIEEIKNSIFESFGKILREEIFADRPLPPFDRVMFDGYAVHSNGLNTNCSLKVESIQSAGDPKKTLSSQQNAIEIMTGAVLPNNCNLVIPYEMVNREGDQIFPDPQVISLPPYSHIHKEASDKKQGDLLCEKGAVINSAVVATAASNGYHELKVSKTIRIAVLTSGDELVNIEQKPEPYQIRKSNGIAIESAIRSTVPSTNFSHFHFFDDLPAILTSLDTIIKEYDLIILSGGISKGKKDFIPEALETVGVKKKFQWVKQRPGKPFWFGNTRDNKPVFALPGNPVSTILGTYYYIIPALQKMLGQKNKEQKFAKLSAAYSFKPNLTCFLPVIARMDKDANLLATPSPTNNSGDYSALLDANGFLVLPGEEKSEFLPGECYEFISI
jgi:molybdopterin molybdotransferase